MCLRAYRLKMVFVALLLTPFCLAAAPATADGWPHPRGPTMNGHAAWQSIRLPLPAAGPPMLWRRGLGAGYSGVVINRGRAITQVQTTAGESVVCLSLQTGNLIWQTIYSPPVSTNDVYPGPYATPVCTGDRIIAAGSRGLICCLNRADGTLLWKQDIVKLGASVAGFGYAATPVVYQGRAFVAAGGQDCAMFALDLHDGSVIWKSGTEGPSYASPRMISVAGEKQLIGFYEQATVAYNPGTGDQLWRDALPSTYNPQSIPPIYKEPFLVRSQTFRRGCRVLRLGRGKPTELAWEKQTLSNDVAPGVIVGNCIYGFDSHEDQSPNRGRTKGLFKCVALATGEEKWRTNHVGQTNIIVCGDKLLLITKKGLLVIIEATPVEYRELCRTQLMEDEQCWAPPALADGWLVVRGSRRTACFFLGEPETVVGQISLTDRIGQTLRHWRRRAVGSLQSDAFMAPRLSHLMFWFVICFVPGVTVLVMPALRARTSWVLAIAAAVSYVATLPVSRLVGSLVFFWPFSVWCCFFLLMRVWQSAEAQASAGHEWRVRAVTLGCILLAGIYMALSRFLGLGMALGFLVGLPAAWGVLRFHSGVQSSRREMVIGIASFVAYYWFSALFILWRNH